MDGTRDHHIKQNKPDRKRQILHIFSQMWIPALKKQTNVRSVEQVLFRGGTAGEGELTVRV
jgi:hypothetical protein